MVLSNQSLLALILYDTGYYEFIGGVLSRPSVRGTTQLPYSPRYRHTRIGADGRPPSAHHDTAARVRAWNVVISGGKTQHATATRVDIHRVILWRRKRQIMSERIEFILMLNYVDKMCAWM